METTANTKPAKPEPCDFTPAIASRRLPINGWVYFFYLEDAGRTKIGYAKDVSRRFRALQTGCPGELSVLGVIPAVNPRALEAAIHKRFRHRRISGEWFEDCEEICMFVNMYGYEEGGIARIWNIVSDEPAPRLPPALRF